MTDFTILTETTTPGGFDGTKIPKLLFGDTIVAFAGHHVIPQDVFNTSDLFIELKNTGPFNSTSFAQNGLPLPSSTAGADIIGSAYHAGPHKAYSDWIGARVADFEARFAIGDFGGLERGQWLEQTAAKINGLVAYAKIELVNPNSSLALVMRDLPLDTALDDLPVPKRFWFTPPSSTSTERQWIWRH